MTVIAPPPAPARVEPGLEPAERDALEALIEEARRRARRRRRRYAVCVLLAATLSALFALSRSGGDAAAPAGRPSLEPRRGAGDLLDREALAAGQLTLIGRSGAAEAPHHDGWYEISMLDANGRLRPFLRCPDEADYCGIAESVAWSRDGRWLAFTVGAHGAINPYIGLHVLDTRSGRQRHIADASVCAFVERSDVAWSPDGSQIAYVCSRAGDRRRTLVLATRDGRIRALHTGRGSLSSPTWSPRGDTIAFATRAPLAKPAILLIDISGSVTTPLALDATAPSWSPDGKRIAYRAGCGGIKLMTPDGLDVTPRGRHVRPSRPPLVPNRPFPCQSIGVAGTPRWSPDGEVLAINNGAGVYLMNKDGSGVRRITAHSGIGHHGGHPAWRPGMSESGDRAR